MLELNNVTKKYGEGQKEVLALKGVSLKFRKSEFVCVLGASGCGKTTLLNVIGGLDRASTGELKIDGVLANSFSSSEWDAYRNKRVGFVFQSYNLIAHQTALENVELALTLSGETGAGKRRKAMLALERVGLAEYLHKKPSELSGGEMQRVAIARAIVNEPDIILADEPTGALDAKNGAQVMEILKEISKTRLVIAVTHNDGLASNYATRVVRLSDGKITADSNPYLGENSVAKNKKCPDKPVNGTFAQNSAQNSAQKRAKNAGGKPTDKSGAGLTKKPKTSMSFLVSLGLSFKNLMTKKVRTALTTFAASVGIVGLALVLALFNGLNSFLAKTQNDTLSAYPLTVQTTETADYEAYVSIITDGSNYQGGEKSDNKIFVNHLITKLVSATVKNDITPEFAEYALNAKTAPETAAAVRDVTFNYGTQMNIYKRYAGYNIESLAKNNPMISATLHNDIVVEYPKVDASQYFKELVNDKDFVLSQYDLIAGKYPTAANELCLVLDKNNGISDLMLIAFLMDLNAADKNADGEYLLNEYDCEEFLKNEYYTKYAVALNDGLYVQTDGVYKKQTRTLKEQLASTENHGSKLGETVAGEIVKEVTKLGIPLPECYYGNSDSMLELNIVGILRLNESCATGCMGLYPLGYTSALSEFFNENCKNSKVVQAQLAEMQNPSGSLTKPYRNVTKEKSGDDAYLTESGAKDVLKTLGYAEKPVAVYFYAKDFNGKSAIKQYIAEYNEGKAESEKIYASDLVGTVFDVLQSFINTITTILLVLTAIALFVAAIMIAVITYVSVLERTREIGILRAIGARKIDVLGVFNAETVIIGVFSGVLGIILALILTLPLNAVLASLTGFANLAVLSPVHALILVGVSIAVTFIAGFVPALIASKKDPVEALRSND